MPQKRQEGAKSAAKRQKQAFKRLHHKSEKDFPNPTVKINKNQPQSHKRTNRQTKKTRKLLTNNYTDKHQPIKTISKHRHHSHICLPLQKTNFNAARRQEGAKSAAKRQKTGVQKPTPQNRKDCQTHESTKYKKSANGGTKKATQRPPKPQNPKKQKTKS